MALNETRRLDGLAHRVEVVEEGVQTTATLMQSIVHSNALQTYKHDQLINTTEKIEASIVAHDEVVYNRFREHMAANELRDQRLIEAIQANRDVLISTVDAKLEKHEVAQTLLERRIDEIQKWIWLATGGAAAASFVIDKLFNAF